MSKTLENLKSGNYEVVDNKGVSVTQHFIECLEKEFADIETKLKEKDEQIKRRIAVYEKQFIEQTNENCELKQQLAEKDKEIEELIEELDDKNFCRDFVDLYTENRLKTQLLNENWKDKISFAVEQLEKVKSAFGLINSKLDKVETIKEYIYYIDHQIKQLKEMK